MSEYWIPPDEDWVRAQAAAAMIGYKPPEITAEMIGIYEGQDPDPLNLFNNPHRVVAAQISGFKQGNEDERGAGTPPDQDRRDVPGSGQLGDV